MSKTKEEILGPSCYPHECGSMVSVQPHDLSLKAMEEYSQQQLSEYKEKLKADIEKAKGDEIKGSSLGYLEGLLKALTLIDKIQ